MSPEEKCAYLCRQHERFKDGLLQAEPPVFRYIVNKFPHLYQDYARNRQFFEGLPVAAEASSRFFTFQDAQNYSILGAPRIGIKKAGGKERQLPWLEEMFNSGAEIDARDLAGALGADWQIVTTDRALLQAFRQSTFFRGIVRESNGAFRAYVPGRPTGPDFAQILAFIKRFQGDFLIHRVLADAWLDASARQLADIAANHWADRRDAWL